MNAHHSWPGLTCGECMEGAITGLESFTPYTYFDLRQFGEKKIKYFSRRATRGEGGDFPCPFFEITKIAPIFWGEKGSYCVHP